MEATETRDTGWYRSAEETALMHGWLLDKILEASTREDFRYLFTGDGQVAAIFREIYWGQSMLIGCTSAYCIAHVTRGSR